MSGKKNARKKEAATVQKQHQKTKSAGFTLIEIVLVIIIIGLALPGLSAFFIDGMQNSSEATILNVAQNLLRGTLDEARSKKWDEKSPVPPGSYTAVPGNEPGESRAGFDDLDDYNGLSEVPLLNPQGGPSGLDTYSQTATVCYVDLADLDTCVPGPTNYKRVEIAIGTLDQTGAPPSAVAVFGNYR